MQLLESLRWRYATKQMNGQQIQPEILSQILEAVKLAPSSYGLTPYKIIHIQDPEIKAGLSPSCYSQPQIIQCSSLLVFCAKTNLSQDTVDDFIQSLSQFRGQTLDSLERYRSAVLQTIQSLTPEGRIEWAHRQAYIALGFGLVAAASLGVDSTPMEGFSRQSVDQVLGLESKNLTSSCILTLGYRETGSDYLVGLPKFRFPDDELFINL
ncbi:NAD(P)H-dependent oxidoreductase [bacterium]|nr:NAD(P)H-dependent oxidoreductase [Candidatus Elulimicrobium humile]